MSLEGYTGVTIMHFQADRSQRLYLGHHSAGVRAKGPRRAFDHDGRDAVHLVMLQQAMHGRQGKGLLWNMVRT